jgi:hypothetical protein
VAAPVMMVAQPMMMVAQPGQSPTPMVVQPGTMVAQSQIVQPVAAPQTVQGGVQSAPIYPAGFDPQNVVIDSTGSESDESA